MTPVLQSGAAAEPLSLIEAKNWLRVDHTNDDGLIQALITASRLVIEAQTQLLLMQQQWRLVLDAWPQVNPLTLPLKPLISVDTVRVSNAAGDFTIMSPSDYQVSALPHLARLYFDKPPSIPHRPVAGIEIDTTAGFGPEPGDVPEELRQAIRLTLAHWYQNRGDAVYDARAVPAEIRTIVSQWRSVRLT